MKVWVDVLTPKQADFFSVFVRRLKIFGHKPIVTTRHYREAEALLRIRNTEAKVIGKHGGADLAAKLVESSKRIIELAGFINENSPDLAVSFCSPEAARVAYGLRCPHYAVCDSPHAEAVCRLSLPLTLKLFTPKAVPTSAWRKYGVKTSDIVRYDAIDPVVWIRAYLASAAPFNAPGFDAQKQTVVIRPVEEHASYMLPVSRSNITVELVSKISGLGAQVVVLPRYEEQVETLSKKLAGTAIVPTEVIDAIGLLKQATVFLGEGGTMSAEAALMGVPTISCYPSEPTYIDRYLFRLRLAERVLDSDTMVERVRQYLVHPELSEGQNRRAKQALARMEDPMSVIMASLKLGQ